MLYWIVKYIYCVDCVVELVDLGFFICDEYLIFWWVEDFLWVVCCNMYLIVGCLVEQLIFDMQVEVVYVMGYCDQGGCWVVEIFMQEYFIYVICVGELMWVFLVVLEGWYLYKVLIFGMLFFCRKCVKFGFWLDQGWLNYIDEVSFFVDLLNMFLVFEEMLCLQVLLYFDVMCVVVVNLKLIDDCLCQDFEVVWIFLDLLLKYGNFECLLWCMNELGVLGVFILEFVFIVVMMQFNVYYYYMVDEYFI